MRKILLFALLPLVLGTSPAVGSDLTQLVGTVGPGFTIDLTDANGKYVDVLTEGRYEVLVHDLSDVHNFALGNATTNTRIFTGGIEFVGDETFTVDLAPGSYAYACSAHPDTMNGRFRVIATPPPPVTTKTLSAKVTSRAVPLAQPPSPPARTSSQSPTARSRGTSTSSGPASTAGRARRSRAASPGGSSSPPAGTSSEAIRA